MTDDLAVIEQTTRQLPAVQAADAMVARGEVTVEEVVAQRDKVAQVMHAVMKQGVHYGLVPGVSKPTLFKPGAEVLAVTFRLAPSYVSDRQFDGDHLTVVTRTTLTHIPTGMVVAEGEGLCTTRESKYAYRQAGRTCPECGAEAIIKGKQEYGGGWVCFKRKDGCGAKFQDHDVRISGQVVGRVANPELPDTWNTVLKMANKRALVAAILNGTAASDIFTQDVEDVGATAADAHETSDDTDSAPAPAASSAPPWNRPQSWREIFDRLAARIGADDVPEWLEQALLVAHDVESVRDVQDDALRDEIANELCDVIRYLDDADTDPMAPGGTGMRHTIQTAFAVSFDGLAGIVIDGPPWRLGPEETERPTHDEYVEAMVVLPQTLADEESPYDQPVVEQTTDPAYADNIDIPFGGDDESDSPVG